MEFCIAEVLFLTFYFTYAFVFVGDARKPYLLLLAEQPEITGEM